MNFRDAFDRTIGSLWNTLTFTLAHWAAHQKITNPTLKELLGVMRIA